MATRDRYLDALKFFLICLVVLGHIGYNHYGLRINRIIYSFHMPLFVMISGYFTHSQVFRRFLRSSFKLLALYVIFQTLNLLFDFFVMGSSFEFRDYLNPAIGLWYLLCLFLWRWMYAIFKISGRGLYFALPASLALSVAVGYIPLGNDFLAFQRIFTFLPFFVIGLILRQVNGFERIRKLSPAIVLPILLVALLIAFRLPTFMPKSPYEGLYDPCYRLFQSLLAVVICFGVIRLFPRNLPTVFSNWGSKTLYIFLYHVFFVKALTEVCTRYQFELDVFGAILCVVVIVTTIMLMLRVKFFRLLVLDY